MLLWCAQEHFYLLYMLPADISKWTLEHLLHVK